MKVSDLRAGMVVKIRREIINSNQTDAYFLAMVCTFNTKNGSLDKLGISSEDYYWPIDCFNDELVYVSPIAMNTIVEIYDIPFTLYKAYELSTESRKLIWSRKEIDWKNVERMTRVLAKEFESDHYDIGYYIKYDASSSFPHKVLFNDRDHVVRCKKCKLIK